MTHDLSSSEACGIFRTCVPSIGRQILNHRDHQGSLSLKKKKNARHYAVQFIQIIDLAQPACKVDNMIPNLQTRGLRLREVR